MSKNLIKPKKDCNCKTREEISNITRMIDDDVLTEMKKQNKYSYYPSSFVVHLIAYMLVPFIFGYMMYSLIFKKNKELKIFNYLLKSHRPNGKKNNKNKG